MAGWLQSATHQRWLDEEFCALLRFGRHLTDVEDGVAWLNDDGSADVDQPVNTYNVARMLHIYGLGQLAGVPGCRRVADHMLRALRSLEDAEHGGFIAERHRGVETNVNKSAYDHVHVLLGASTAAIAGLEGADDLLREAASVVETRFLDAGTGLLVDETDRAWRPLEYRGANANMHGVEAMLAAADATGDRVWAERAAHVASFFIARAEEHGWRLPEHYTADWRVVLDYNRDDPAHRFKPYGSTIGHSLEWARLLLHVEAATGSGEPEWLTASEALFARGFADGWGVDGAPGFVYTVDFDGTPITRDRLWWVVAEGIGAASALLRRTGKSVYAERYRLLWDYAADHLLDPDDGSWTHQLNPDNTPNHTIWPGKPDLYHCAQATLVPRLPLAPQMARAIADGAFDVPAAHDPRRG